ASVAWISELKNVLSLTFFLPGLLWYLRFDEVQHARAEAQRAQANSKPFYSLSLLAFLLALLSKTSTVMLPSILLACCWWRRDRMEKADWFRIAPFLLLALCFGLLTVWF